MHPYFHILPWKTVSHLYFSYRKPPEALENFPKRKNSSLLHHGISQYSDNRDFGIHPLIPEVLESDWSRVQMLK